MSYCISLEIFEGPLDLLLHLIQKQQIDIYDIPIAKITEQYLEYLFAMQQLDLDLASDFLVMAATLLAIKAKMLLPRQELAEEQENSASADPRDELVNRLLEYQKYKSVAGVLRAQEEQQSLKYYRPPDQELMARVLKNTNPLEGINLEDLLAAFKKIIAVLAEENIVQEIVRDQVTINDKINYITKCLANKQEGVLFYELCPFSCTSRLEIVLTFLALLELVRMQKIIVCQVACFGALRIYPKVCQEDQDGVF